MEKQIECFKDLVGIIRDECYCLTGGLPPEKVQQLKTSLSGLYVEELPGMMSMKALKNADTCKGFADLAIEAQNTAIRTTRDDLVIAINDKYRVADSKIAGTLGRREFAGTVTTATKLYQGFELTLAKDAGRALRVKSMELITNIDGIRKAYIYRKDKYGALIEIASADVTVIANRYSPVIFKDSADQPITIELPFMVDDVQAVYYFAWEKAQPGDYPRDSDFGCGGCGQNANDKYADYLQIKGAQWATDTLSGLVYDTFSHGVIVDFDLTCNSNLIICRAYDRSQPVDVAIANALNYKTGELLIEKVLASPEINRYTMMDRERLFGKRNSYRTEYNNRIMYAADQIQLNTTDCFICRSVENQPAVRPILT